MNNFPIFNSALVHGLRSIVHVQHVVVMFCYLKITLSFLDEIDVPEILLPCAISYGVLHFRCCKHVNTVSAIIPDCCSNNYFTLCVLLLHLRGHSILFSNDDALVTSNMQHVSWLYCSRTIKFSNSNTHYSV